MTELKLARLPDRTPVKVSISVLPGLHRTLEDYARVYQQVHGSAVSIAELVPAMLSAFIDSDRAFAKARQELGNRDNR